MPPTTWKLNIWAAKMNAAVTPISGTARSSSVALVLRTAIARTTIVTSPHTRRDRDGQEAVRARASGAARRVRARDPRSRRACGSSSGGERRW